MQERGNLIRTDLAQELRDRLRDLGRAFDPLFDDLAVEGSDGIGRKTEAPWVRLYSKAMSPTPREGFYIVIHFSANGSAFFVTIGCGSTIWSGGDLRPISDGQLKAKTTWARSVVEQRWGTLEPFSDAIALGARASFLFVHLAENRLPVAKEALRHTERIREFGERDQRLLGIFGDRFYKA